MSPDTFLPLIFMFTLESDSEVYKKRFLENWGDMTSLKKPVIAAVSGYAVRASRYLVHSGSGSHIFAYSSEVGANSH